MGRVCDSSFVEEVERSVFALDELIQKHARFKGGATE